MLAKLSNRLDDMIDHQMPGFGEHRRGRFPFSGGAEGTPSDDGTATPQQHGGELEPANRS
jgi:hypothetical protein